MYSIKTIGEGKYTRYTVREATTNGFRCHGMYSSEEQAVSRMNALIEGPTLEELFDQADEIASHWDY